MFLVQNQKPPQDFCVFPMFFFCQTSAGVSRKLHKRVKRLTRCNWAAEIRREGKGKRGGEG